MLRCLVNRQQEKPIEDRERDGLKKLVQEIGGVWKRAKERQSKISKGDEEDAVYHYMRLKSNRNGKVPMVWKLQEIDAVRFDPGNWFRSLTCSQRGCSQTGFDKSLARAEAQVEGFRWLSWQQVDE